MAVSRKSANHTASRILRGIWQKPGLSRIQLASALKLDKSTITNQVARLLQAGVIQEIEEGQASARGGRKPISLGIDPNFGTIIGIEIQVDDWVAVAVDLRGGVLTELRGNRSLRSGDFAKGMLEIIKTTTAGLCPPGSGKRLLGVGVGVGGLINMRRSMISYSVPLGIMTALDFSAEVASKLPFPCYIENDANCCAWGELAFNRRRNLRDFLFALVEYRRSHQALEEYGGMGVGFGIVLGGKVHQGAHGNAGEFRSVLCDSPGDVQFSLPKSVISKIGKEPSALSAVADELARNMAMLVNTMDISKVFVGGDIELFDIDFPSVLRRRLEENWMYPSPKDIEIAYSSLGPLSVAYGAAGLVLDQLISEQVLLARAGID
jgi:predicted NBD/HSP70 family sugar kinase